MTSLSEKLITLHEDALEIQVVKKALANDVLTRAELISLFQYVNSGDGPRFKAFRGEIVKLLKKSLKE